MWDQVGRPGDVACAEPAAHKIVTAMLGNDLRDEDLVGFGGSGREGERNFAETKLEQAVSPAGLAVVIAEVIAERSGVELASAISDCNRCWNPDGEIGACGYACCSRTGSSVAAKAERAGVRS